MNTGTLAMNPPITPGEILLEEYLQPMGISQNAMTRAIGVAPHAINEIMLGKRAITPAMPIRFGAFFGQSPEFWHGIPVKREFRVLAKQQKRLTARIRPAVELAQSPNLQESARPLHPSSAGANILLYLHCCLVLARGFWVQII
jgi:antitoxin HigA-1